MGVDLNNERGGYFGCDGTAWKVYRRIAQEFGWEPRGTLRPAYHEGKWSGTYEGTDGQRVTGEDAKEIAAALERALAAPHLEEILFRIWRVNADPEVLKLLYEFERRKITELAAFCRGGGFRVS